MQRYTIFIIIVTVAHVSGRFSAHHQELRNCIHSIWYLPSLLAATVKNSLKIAQNDTETCQSYSEKVISLHTVCTKCW
jgi:succinate dehydrogenase hydrophobic anchor subunit